MADQNPPKKNVIDLRQLTAQSATPSVPTPVATTGSTAAGGTATSTTGTSQSATDPYNIPAVVREKYPELIALIKDTKSMSDDERKYWFQVLPIMTPDQVNKLKTILVTEKTQLSELDKQYEQEIVKLNEKHLLEWKEFEAREQRQKLKAKESKHQEEDKKIEEDLLQKLADV